MFRNQISYVSCSNLVSLRLLEGKYGRIPLHEFILKGYGGCGPSPPRKKSTPNRCPSPSSPAIDESPTPLLLALMVRGVGDPRPSLGVVVRSLKPCSINQHRCYGGYGDVVRNKNKIFSSAVVVDLVWSTCVTGLMLADLDPFQGSSATTSALGCWFLRACAQDLPVVINKLKPAPIGEWRHGWLALTAILVVWWTKDLDASSLCLGYFVLVVKFYNKYRIF